MIYVNLPTGDGHEAGIRGDSLVSALKVLVAIERLHGDSPAASFLPGSLLQLTGENFRPRPSLRAKRHIGYAIFEADLVARRMANQATGVFDVIAAGSRWCEEVLHEAGLSDVVTIHGGIDPNLFNVVRAQRQCHRQRFVIFSGGRLDIQKGQDVVIRAFKAFSERHDDAFLVAAWQNPFRKSSITMKASPHFPMMVTEDFRNFDDVLERWLNTTGIDRRRIQLVPRLPNSEMAAIYADSDVGLFPNRCEGDTNVVMMQYMACGHTVVATDFAGHKDVLTDANSFRLRSSRLTPFYRWNTLAACWCEPDVEEIVESLEVAYSEQDRLVNKGRVAASDMARWTWERTARQFAALLG